MGNGTLVIDDSVRSQARARCGRASVFAGHGLVALYVLSVLEAPWLGRQQHCLRHYLGQADAKSLTRLTRRRTTTVEYWCRIPISSRSIDSTRPSVVTGVLTCAFQPATTDAKEVYVIADAMDDVARPGNAS